MSESVLCIGSAYVVPNTGKPVSHDHVEADEQYEHHSPVLDVSVYFANHTAKPK